MGLYAHFKMVFDVLNVSLWHENEFEKETIYSVNISQGSLSTGIALLFGSYHCYSSCKDFPHVLGSSNSSGGGGGGGGSGGGGTIMNSLDFTSSTSARHCDSACFQILPISEDPCQVTVHKTRQLVVASHCRFLHNYEGQRIFSLV